MVLGPISIGEKLKSITSNVLNGGKKFKQDIDHRKCSMQGFQKSPTNVHCQKVGGLGLTICRMVSFTWLATEEMISRASVPNVSA